MTKTKTKAPVASIPGAGGKRRVRNAGGQDVHVAEPRRAPKEPTLQVDHDEGLTLTFGIEPADVVSFPRGRKG
jgi:hypothetical protein